MTDRSGPPTWIFWVILSFVIVIVLVILASIASSLLTGVTAS
jgi:hypothetical protein